MENWTIAAISLMGCFVIACVCFTVVIIFILRWQAKGLRYKLLCCIGLEEQPDEGCAIMTSVDKSHVNQAYHDTINTKNNNCNEEVSENGTSKNVETIPSQNKVTNEYISGTTQKPTVNIMGKTPIEINLCETGNTVSAIKDDTEDDTEYDYMAMTEVNNTLQSNLRQQTNKCSKEVLYDSVSNTDVLLKLPNYVNGRRYTEPAIKVDYKYSVIRSQSIALDSNSTYAYVTGCSATPTSEDQHEDGTKQNNINLVEHNTDQNTNLIDNQKDGTTPNTASKDEDCIVKDSYITVGNFAADINSEQDATDVDGNTTTTTEIEQDIYENSAIQILAMDEEILCAINDDADNIYCEMDA